MPQSLAQIYLHVVFEALHVLDWQTPGRVWAMDFAQAPRPIDGLYPHSPVLTTLLAKV
jgi:hypothetical protein